MHDPDEWEEPEHPVRRPVRRPPRTVAVTPETMRVVVVVGALALGLAVLWWTQGRPAAGTVVPLSPASATPVDASASPSTHSAELIVDVRGAVRNPGVRRLPAGSRVIDAIEAAGGLRGGRGYGSVNLAALVTDGQQIVVGEQQPASPAGAGTPSAPGSSGGPLVNLNTAAEPELEALDGIGPVLASQIVAWRTDHGPFRTVDDLLDVSGIGEATLAGIRDQVTVG